VDLSRLQDPFLCFLLYRVRGSIYFGRTFVLIPRDLALALAIASCASIARQPRAAMLLPRRATATPRQPPRAQARHAVAALQPSSLRRPRKPPRLPCPRSPGPLATAPPKSPLPSLTTRLSRVCNARIKTEGFSRPLIQPLPYLLDWYGQAFSILTCSIVTLIKLQCTDSPLHSGLLT